ncbi:MAG: hypothetical protein OEY28_00105 [Nitrospira sp.]|nr:hypothetical protein [Nitrospira sp.]
MTVKKGSAPAKKKAKRAVEKNFRTVKTAAGVHKLVPLYKYSGGKRVKL